MAGRIENLKPIKPGEVRNPRGGSRKATEKKLMKQLINKEEMEEIGKLILQGKLKKLQEIVDDANPAKGGKQRHSVMKTMFAAQALQAMKGKTEAFNALLDRLLGKVPAAMQLTSPDGSMRPTVVFEIPDNGFRAAKDPSEPDPA